jgi:hypothetical protein
MHQLGGKTAGNVPHSARAFESKGRLPVNEIKASYLQTEKSAAKRRKKRKIVLTSLISFVSFASFCGRHTLPYSGLQLSATYGKHL